MASARRTGTNESISTYGNGTRNYTSLQTWEDATDNDNVTGTVSPVLECYDDSASFDDYVLMAGATNNATYFRIVRPASGQGHDGTPNNGVTFINTTDTPLFNITEAYTEVQDIIAKQNINSTTTRNTFAQSGAVGGGYVGCIAFDGVNAGTGGVNGFSVGNNKGAIDCLAHNNEGPGFIVSGGTASTNAFCYNCTSTNNATYGFELTGTQATATRTLKNCLASGNTTADFAATAAGPTNAVSYCASADATADDFGGSGNRVSQTFTFVNAAGNDFHLATNDAGAKDFGTDLSADALYAFNDDIDKDTISGSWNIGFDWESVASASLSPSLSASLSRSLSASLSASLSPSLSSSPSPSPSSSVSASPSGPSASESASISASISPSGPSASESASISPSGPSPSESASISPSLSSSISPSPSSTPSPSESASASASAGPSIKYPIFGGFIVR